jgi:ankyrin repeat protein
VLVHLGADKDAAAPSGVALHKAAYNGHAETVTVLVQMGASLEKKDADGGTPLHCAAQQGHVNVVRALVHGGANKEAKGFDGELRCIGR